jgi:hypothetical protein
MTDSQIVHKDAQVHKTSPEHKQPTAFVPTTKTPVRNKEVQRALINPQAASPKTVLRLQRAAGNNAVHGLLQRKMVVGAAQDAYEKEADQVAGKVMAQSTSQAAEVQRTPGEEEEVQAAPLAGSITSLAQRAPEDEEEVQTSRQDPQKSFEVSSDIENQLHVQRGRGSQLPGDVRQNMEERFGMDFSSVRVHTGGESSQLNRQLSAQAFTQGQDIYMGEGKYDPGSNQGKKLLAHELTHVVQQTGKGSVQRKGKGRIQRYSMANMNQPGPINWQGETTSVTRPGEGVSGGVFIFHSDEDVVVKPENMAAPSKVRAMEQTLKAGNVPVAEAHRIVDKGSPEAVAIQQTVKDKPGIPEEKKPELIGYLNKAVSILVMPKVGGKSLSSLLKDAQSQAKIDQLIQALNQPKLLTEIGRMSIIDAFMGNEDRLNAFIPVMGLKGKANLGNIMIAGNEIATAVAIDNAAFWGNAPTNEGATPMNKDYTLDDFQQMRKNQIRQAEFFFESMLSFLPEKTGEFDPKAYFRQRFDLDAARTFMVQGMNEAAQNLVTLMSDKKRRAALKAAMLGQEENWAAMRGRAAWLNAESQGATQEEAMARANEYMQMRRGGKEFKPVIDDLLKVDPSLSQVPNAPKPGIRNRFSSANKNYQTAKNTFIEAIQSRAQDMHWLASEIDAAITRSKGTGVEAKEAQGMLHYVASKLGSDYGSTIAGMIGKYKTIWFAWMATLNPKKDPKERQKLVKTFDLLRQGQEKLMDAIGRARAADVQRMMNVQRKETPGLSATPPPGEKK